MIKQIVLILVALAVLGASIYFYYQQQISKLPKNNPEEFKNKFPSGSPKPVIFCFGDSITHGIFGYSYVDHLRDIWGDQYEIVNAGMNGQMSFQTLEAVKSMEGISPISHITFMIGTNDAMSSLNLDLEAQYNQSHGIPQTGQRSSLEWYEENLEKLIDYCQENYPNTHIGVYSITPLTEIYNSKPYLHSKKFAQKIKQIVIKKGVWYLPLFEEMEPKIKQLHDDGKESTNDLGELIEIYPLMFRCAQKRYILLKSWDNISEGYGLVYLTDNVHFNSKVAQYISALFEKFIQANPPISQ